MFFRTFVLCHRPPLYVPPVGAAIVWLSISPPPVELEKYEIILPDNLDPRLMAWQPFLSGLSGSFAVNEYLHRNSITDGRIVNINWRRFLTTRELGVEARNYPGMRILRPTELDDSTVEQEIALCQTDLLMPKPVQVGDLLSQYYNCHPLQDFLRFIAIALDKEVLKKEDVYDLFHGKIVIPGALEFGLYPVKVYMELVKQLKSIAFEFVSKCPPTCLDPYQRRAVAFSSERLGTFLLKKELDKRKSSELSSPYFGYTACVSDTDWYQVH